VFWNKGDTAFVTEGKDENMTYSDCVTGNSRRHFGVPIESRKRSAPRDRLQPAR
jgi:hypothetical protein